jgi:hypothetical protein
MIWLWQRYGWWAEKITRRYSKDLLHTPSYAGGLPHASVLVVVRGDAYVIVTRDELRISSLRVRTAYMKEDIERVDLFN